MWSRHQPEWLYEALPYIYAASGIATILVLRNGMAAFSGLLLISAGAFVWFMRTTSRKQAREVPRHAKDRATPIARPGFLEIVWRREYEVGHPKIDAQHRGLFATANALLDVISMNQSKPDVERLLDQLVGDLEQHFRDEESILEASDRGVAETHRRLHNEVRKRLAKVRTDYSEGKVRAPDLVSLLIYDLIGQHVTNEDRVWAARVRRPVPRV